MQRIVFGLLDSQTREGKISPMTFLYWNKVSLLLTSDVSVELVTVCVQFATIGGLEIRTVRHNLCSALHSVVSKDTTLCNAEQRLWDFPHQRQKTFCLQNHRFDQSALFYMEKENKQNVSLSKRI